MSPIMLNLYKTFEKNTTKIRFLTYQNNVITMGANLHRHMYTHICTIDNLTTL